MGRLGRSREARLIPRNSLPSTTSEPDSHRRSPSSSASHGGSVGSSQRPSHSQPRHRSYGHHRQVQRPFHRQSHSTSSSPVVQSPRPLLSSSPSCVSCVTIATSRSTQTDPLAVLARPTHIQQQQRRVVSRDSATQTEDKDGGKDQEQATGPARILVLPEKSQRRVDGGGHVKSKIVRRRMLQQSRQQQAQVNLAMLMVLKLQTRLNAEVERCSNLEKDLQTEKEQGERLEMFLEKEIQMLQEKLRESKLMANITAATGSMAGLARLTVEDSLERDDNDDDNDSDNNKDEIKGDESATSKNTHSLVHPPAHSPSFLAWSNLTRFATITEDPWRGQ